MNIKEEGGGMFDTLKRATPNPLKMARAGIGRASEKAQSALAARAAAKASQSLLGSVGSVASRGSLTRGVGSRSLPLIEEPSPTFSVVKILVIIIATGVLSSFMTLTIQKSDNFKDSIVKWAILMIVLIFIPIFAAFMIKRQDVLGSLLATMAKSQINIICIYAILAFTAWSTLANNPSIDTWNSMSLWDKVQIISLLIVPLLIILYTVVISKNMTDAIVMLVVAVITAAILLSPKWF